MQHDSARRPCRLPFSACVLIAIAVAPAFGQETAHRLLFSFYDTPQPSTSAIMQPLYRGVAVSTDAGVTWRSSAWPTNRNNDIAADPDTPTTLYLASDYGLHRSTDNGGTWKQITPSVIPAVLRVICAERHIWLATAGGVFLSTDDGASWLPRSIGLPPLDGTYVSDLAFDGGAMLAATQAGVFRSDDRGMSWHGIGLRGTPVLAILRHKERCYALTASDGLFGSAGDGTSWTRLTDSIGSRNLLAIAVHPTDGSILLGTSDIGILRSSDGGATWANQSGGLFNMHVTAIAFRRGDPTTVYAGTENGSFVSRNGGLHWQAFSVRLGYISAILAD